MDNDSSYVLSGSSSVNTNATVHLNISEKGNTSITSQIFDINHFQDILNTAHVCYGGGRLEFVPDVLPCSGLFHHNILRCTKCGNETPLTNFPVIHPIKTTQQEPNKRLTLAAATTGVGYRATKSIMSTLSLSIQSERTFLKQLHKFYDDMSILTKSKHHGFRAVRGSAALAAMYFNSGSSILIDYFKQHGIKTSEILLKHLFEKDKKRIINFKNNNEQRQNRIKKKASDRQNSIKAASDVVDYNPGGFNY
ncbi:unnamed protein product [Rotaria sordida]|nr:unnamed protein product [Rotaria sordida]